MVQDLAEIRIDKYFAVVWLRVQFKFLYNVLRMFSILVSVEEYDGPLYFFSLAK